MDSSFYAPEKVSDYQDFECVSSEKYQYSFQRIPIRLSDLDFSYFISGSNK